jgi:hypothetical protein
VQRGRDQPGAGAADRVPERDRAAVHVDQVLVRLVHGHPGQHDGRERLVDLEQVQLADLHPAPREQPVGRLHRAVQVVVRLRADQALRDDPGTRGHAVRACDGLVHQQYGGGAVGDLRRRTGGMYPVVEHRLQPGERFERGVAQALVPGHVADRYDLAVEVAGVPCRACPVLRPFPEPVQVLSGQSTSDSDPLGSAELVGQVDRPVVRPWRADVDAHVAAQRHPAHRLDAARDADVDGAGRDLRGDEVHGLLRGAALRVDGHAAGLMWQAGVQPGGAGDVVRLFARLRDAAAEHLLDQGGVDAGAVDHGLLGDAEQCGGVPVGQHPLPPADRRACGGHDHRVSHEQQSRTRSQGKQAGAWFVAAACASIE